MYAIIENGIVANLVIWDGSSDWAPPAGATAVLAPEGTLIGDTYSGGAFTPSAGESGSTVI
jgi:hypothetical protein